MKVVYDTSALGFGQYEETGRTGVYRTVENLARGLSASSACELFFSASESWRMWVYAKCFTKQNPQLASVPFLSPRLSAYLVEGMYYPLSALTQRKEIPLALRAVRRGLGEVTNLFERHKAPLSRANLEGKDIFHSPYWPLPEATKSVPKLRRFLTVHDVISIVHPELGHDGGAFLKKIIFSAERGDWVTCVSHFTREELLSVHSGLDPARVLVVPNAVSSEDFYPVSDRTEIERVQRGHGLLNPYMLSVCSLDKRKNLEGLIRAFATWVKQEKINDLELALVGAKTPLEGTLHALIRKLGMEGRVKVLGFVPNKELSPLYSGALAFVYPSFLEGFGLPPLEAMRCGTSVICSNTGSLPEVVGDAAIQIDPKTETDLCAALDRVYRSPSLREELGRASLAQAAKFSWEKSTAALLDAFRAAL